MSTGTFCTTCRKYIDLPEQPVAEQWRCNCARPARSDGRVVTHKDWCEWRSTGKCECGARAYVKSTPRPTLAEFHHGRIDAKVIDERKLGFIFVEFMREGDEEQHFDMTLGEAIAFQKWLNAVLPSHKSTS